MSQVQKETSWERQEGKKRKKGGRKSVKAREIQREKERVTKNITKKQTGRKKIYVKLKKVDQFTKGKCNFRKVKKEVQGAKGRE